MSDKDTRTISEMRNLGPACEADLNAIGITTAEQVKKLGVEETFLRIMIGRSQLGRSSQCCNASYLYAIHGAINDVDWRDIPPKQKERYKAFAKEVRESGRFK